MSNGFTSQFSITDHIQDVLDEMLAHKKKALETVGLLAEGNAKVNITKHKAVDTGNLRNSISHKIDINDFSAYIGTNVEYAPYVEYGTGQYAEEGGRQTPWTYQDEEGEWHRTSGMKPRPYLRPAVSEHMDEYQTAFNDEFKS